MADFRKWALVLVALALIAVPASAAPAIFTCNASVVTNPLIRAEGLTELVGDIVLTCQGNGNVSTPGTTLFPNFVIQFNTYATSKIVNATSGATEALMVLDEAGSTTNPTQIAGANIFQGFVGSNSQIQWNGVPIPTVPDGSPAGSTRTIRFTNLRVNASQIGVAANTFVTSPVIATLSITGTSGMQISNNGIGLQVAQVTKGLDVDLRKAATPNTDSYSATFQQCTSKNKDLATDNTATTGALDFVVRYKELFASAFKPIGGATGNLAQFVPGASGTAAAWLSITGGNYVIGAGGQTSPSPELYFNESGLLLQAGVNTGVGAVSPISNPTLVGQANQGTRLFARFANVPAGVALFVTTAQVAGINNANGTPSGVKAILVGSDPTLGGNSQNPTPVAATATAPAPGLAPVTLSGGTGTAVWEVTQSASNVQEYVGFGVVVAYVSNTTSNLPGLTVTAAGTTPATVNGGFAPISAVVAASSTAPIPRFVDMSTTLNAFNTAACVTNLLFPYVVNIGGFDTGIAVANTSLDNSGNPAKVPFNTTTQHGACTFYYFGTMASGQLPTPQTTADIPAGQMVAFAISQGGVAGSGANSAAGFAGYIIARCAFQYAHGFAFVSDVGVNRVAHGYLALVIPDRTRVADPFSSAAPGSGEQLAY